MTATHIRQYLNSRQDGHAATTVHTEARALRAFFNFCVAEEWITASPLRKGMMPKKPRLVSPALTESQIRQVLKRATSQEQAIVLVLLDTGLRVSELCKLDFADVDIATGRVQVRQGKGAKDRVVFLGARSRKALLRYWGEWGISEGRVFLTQRGRGPLSRGVVSRTVARMGKRTGVHVSPHTLRRAFAVLNLRAGMDVYTLARLMGHESIDTLRQYLPLVDGDMEAAHARLAVVDRL